MDSDVITVNNFFGHWITDIDIRRYPDDTRILLTNNNVDVLKFPIEIFTKKFSGYTFKIISLFKLTCLFRCKC